MSAVLIKRPPPLRAFLSSIDPAGSLTLAPSRLQAGLAKGLVKMQKPKAVGGGEEKKSSQESQASSDSSSKVSRPDYQRDPSGSTNQLTSGTGHSCRQVHFRPRKKQVQVDQRRQSRCF